MIKKKTARFSVVVLAVASLAATVTVLGMGPVGSGGSPKSTFSLEKAQTFANFPVYYAGDSVRDIPLVAVLRRNDSATYVSFIYGECDARGDAGCAPPGEVQVWPACRRNPSLYAGLRSSISPVPEQTTVRGVPAASFEDGHRLEIQTGVSTVVIFGDSPQFVLELANALRGTNNDVHPGAALPPPHPGAVDGSLPCDQ
ncbi:MAG: hypothetical protein ABIO78_08585 [Thermoanaerobaculia bacterium]